MTEGQQPTLERAIPGPKDDRPGLLLRTPYDEGFVEDLKDSINPPADRYWSPELEGWWLGKRHEETAIKLAVRAFGGIRIIAEDGDYVVDAHGRSRQGRLL